MNKITCVVLGFLLFSHTSYGCSNEMLAKHLAQFIDANGAGISALVANRENEVCLAAVGMANTELSVSMEPHHVFEIGSTLDILDFHNFRTIQLLGLCNPCGLVPVAHHIE